VVTAGRYRAEGYGAGAPVGAPCVAGNPDSDQLVFDSATDTCFKPIGTLLNSISTADHLVLNNYGTGFAGQNAYATAGILNRRRISTVASAGTNDRIRFTSATPFDHALHDSAARRFYVVTGNAATALPEPVTFYCAAGTLMRRSGYAMTAAQPTATGAPQALLANNVTGCLFTYAPTVAPQIGLLTLRLTLSRPRTDGGAETVSLYHAAHVSNVP
jgi:MSHA biogenesis protein MshO